jgi:hypothetical protein
LILPYFFSIPLTETELRVWPPVSISHRALNLKICQKFQIKLTKQKSPSRWQLITFSWLILNLKLKLGKSL